MLFNSLDFIIFFMIVVFLHYVLPHKFRWIMLLTASCIFYMCWRAELIVLILFSTLANWGISLLIDKYRHRGKGLLILSIIINFGLLFIFKYMMFINHTFMVLYEYMGWNYPVSDFNIILPMGISFYTFQAASYTIDIYRNDYPPERNYFKFTLFVTFFPQLVAGPIERADRLLNQLFTVKRINVNNFSDGIKLMIMGYFKKIVIADRSAVLVNAVFNNCREYNGLSFIIAAFFFAFQIYGDFSGYSDIARGCARILGIDLMYNFDRPYFSKSIKEFWRRWHISLSTWFRDYVYIPLGGSRCSRGRKYLNLMITFLVSGLWHGANWTYVLWGGLHGLYQVIGDVKNMIIPKWNNFVINFFRVIITFILVVFAWIFFRANTIGDSFYIVSNLFNDIGNITDLQYLYEMFNNFGLQMFEIVIVTGAIAVLIFSEIISCKMDIHKLMNRAPFVLRFAYYYILVIIIFGMGVFSGGGQFIYFQF
ncbi:MAG: MBOAT family O-acyltransferase [Clostridia bacterium]|nr:MBOAT family O-acyltransferase [Clostridia bacterium]